MTVNELCVGNYVYYGPQMVRIVSLNILDKTPETSEDLVGNVSRVLIHKGTGAFQTVDLDCLEPATFDGMLLLDSFGFEMEREPHNGNMKTVLKRASFRLLHSTLLPVDSTFFPLCRYPVKNLHTLQNLFYFTTGHEMTLQRRPG